MSDLRIDTTADGHRLALPDGSASLRLVPRLGLALPRYHFHIGRVVHAAQELALFRVQTTLLLGNDHTGQAELADLQLAPGLGAAQQTAALGALIAAAQALMQQHPQDFGDALVAELPGWRDAAGASPFWQALGARFYAGDPAEAQARLGAAWRSHLAALLPRQTIYLSFLGAAAEASLARADDRALPALAALRAAGFQRPVHARIDDGGPVLVWRAPG
ncbi:arginine N-succinyltransferase [Pelomonas sp. UHG3]|uniref:Arginine N-succinyltransferase n=1 Tax=Roseateles hydrophilus TaxID=2975054 RepID=A0ACC6CBV2_9BURK|nr:arginine N-succinyltransferase [Pelomonas sp. UHG3]MCY4745814.1 arginine N-succinyltransferase [Pelomonas sp. UHG3]